MSTTPFDKIEAGLHEALAHASGEDPADLSLFRLQQVRGRLQSRIDAMNEGGRDSVGISKGFASEIVRAVTEAEKTIAELNAHGVSA